MCSRVTSRNLAGRREPGCSVFAARGRWGGRSAVCSPPPTGVTFFDERHARPVGPLRPAGQTPRRGHRGRRGSPPPRPPPRSGLAPRSVAASTPGTPRRIVVTLTAPCPDPDEQAVIPSRLAIFFNSLHAEDDTAFDAWRS